MKTGHTGRTDPQIQASAKESAIQEHPRRCLDFFISPPEVANTVTVSGTPDELTRFARELQTIQKTGCLKIFNDRLLERAIVLFFKGKVIGCTMTTNKLEDSYNLDENIRRAAVNLGEPDTRLDYCPVEDGVILSYASIFLGDEHKKSPSMPVIEFLARTRESAENHGKAACIIATSYPQGVAQTLMGFIHQGQCIGYFDCSLQKFERDGQKFFDRVSQFPESSEISTTELPEATDFDALGSQLVA